MKTFTKSFFILAILGLLVACQQSGDKETALSSDETKSEIKIESKVKAGMIKVAVMYPNGEGKTFDMDYYVNRHMKMLDSLAGDSIVAMQIDKGIAGIAPEVPVPYLAVGIMYFDNMSVFQNTLPLTAGLGEDIPNFTNIEPIFQISEVQVAE